MTKEKDLNTLTIEDCLKEYKQGNTIDIEDGKVVSITKELKMINNSKLSKAILELNLNTEIKVKLTQEGFDWHKADYLSYAEQFPTMLEQYTAPEVDEDGMSTFTLWEFMNIFGDSFSPRSTTNVIDPLKIYILSK